MKPERLIANIIPTGPPDKAEPAILGVTVIVFWPIQGIFLPIQAVCVVGEPLCDVGTPSWSLKLYLE